MEKLELKHLAAYLPYKLRIKTPDFIENAKEMILYSLDFAHEDDKVGYHLYFKNYGRTKMWVNENKVTPILRPLSDLTKEIEIDGKKFIPIEKLEIDSCGIGLNCVTKMPTIFLESCGFIHSRDVYNNIFLVLLEWHFDIFGLISAGLAIDINTIKND